MFFVSSRPHLMRLMLSNKLSPGFCAPLRLSLLMSLLLLLLLLLLPPPVAYCHPRCCPICAAAAAALLLLLLPMLLFCCSSSPAAAAAIIASTNVFGYFCSNNINTWFGWQKTSWFAAAWPIFAQICSPMRGPFSSIISSPGRTFYIKLFSRSDALNCNSRNWTTTTTVGIMYRLEDQSSKAHPCRGVSKHYNDKLLPQHAN